jgi:L-ascorbate metabolism protein UlaG (beta-lactamase superfamily)
LHGESPASSTEPNLLRVTWHGHSTVLLELDGVRLLTDPVVRTRLLHLKRVADAAEVSVLADVDAVLVSHLHYDHLDLPSLVRLGRSLRLVVPAGAGKLLRRRGFADVAELDVDEALNVGALTIRATPAEHAGRRGPFAKAATVGFLVEGSARAYFAGDTDLFDGMSGLSGDLDLALLPIAGWGPRVPAGHLDPFRAAKALVLLRPRLAVPIHWGTYRRIGLSRDPASLRAPAESFLRHARELAPEVDVRLLPVGGTLEVPAASSGLGDAAPPAGPEAPTTRREE